MAEHDSIIAPDPGNPPTDTTNKRRAPSDEEFQRQIALEAELLDLLAAAAFLGSYVREDVLQTSFLDLTFKTWCDQCNRLNWLAHRIEAHVAAAVRIFDDEGGQPPAIGPEGQP